MPKEHFTNEEAMKYFRKFVNLYPMSQTFLSAYREVIDIHLKSKRPKAAIKLLKEEKALLEKTIKYFNKRPKEEK